MTAKTTDSRRPGRALAAACLGLGLVLAAGAGAFAAGPTPPAGAGTPLPGDGRASAAGDDYPTAVSADYVFGCMQSAGQTQGALQRCACSFDVIASLVPYERYLEASTFLSMGQVTGEKGVLFRTGAEAKASIGDLRRAQAEAEVLCFE